MTKLTNTRQSAKKLKIAASPYIKAPMTTPMIMRTVLYALAPICLFSIYLFGLSSLLLILCTAAICVGTEHALPNRNGRHTTIDDYSAAITGVLLALTLPPGFPLWMAGIAGILAIVLAKYAFGGLGNNVFNPALIGRVIAQTSWPVAITTWTPPFVVHRFTELIPTTLTSLGSKPESLQNWLTTTGIDGFTGATPLSLFKFQHIASDPYALVTGFTPGSTGETSAILIVLCGLYLWWKLRNYGYDGKIPICVLLGALITGGILYLVNSQAYPDPLFILTSGGLLFGAIFMATDPAGAPNTPLGKIIFGLFIGFIVIVIRVFCSYPEGVMFAILCGNAVSPIINELTQPRVYGEKRGGSK